MNITLFGGSFNPPHLGHALVISEFLELNLSDEIWLVPDYHHTFGKEKDYASPEDRLAMLKSLENDKVKIETYNIDRQTSGQTIETVLGLKKLYPMHQFSFLMGSDNLKNFHKWGSWEKLLQEIPFYIYPRANYPFEPLYQNMTPLTSPLQTITNISSTLIRNRIQSKHDTSLLLPDSIIAYIKENHLYKKI